MKKNKLLSITIILLFSCGVDTSEKNNSNNENDSIAIQIGAVELNKKIADQPENAELYYQRGSIYFNSKYLNRAEIDFDEAIRLDSTNALYFYSQGRNYYAMGKTIKSSECFETSIQLKPDFTEAKTKLADLYFFAKEHKKSLLLTTSLLHDDKQNSYAYFLRGMNLKDLGDTSSAIVNFQKAIEYNNNDFDSYMQLGIIHTNIGNTIAIDYLNGALRIKPNDTKALFARAVFLQHQKQFAMALHDYRKVVQFDPQNYQSYYNVGCINIEIFKIKEALRNFEICIKMNTEFSLAYFKRGLCHEIEKKYEDALLNYKFALQLDPNLIDAKEAVKRLEK